jgi:hypothetical protein
MQDLVGDNNRTPVKFQDPDNCNIVGGICSNSLFYIPSSLGLSFVQ